MAKSVTLENGRVWGSKKEALAHYKDMLARYSVGDQVSDSSDHADLAGLLRRYDKSTRQGESKIGSGIDYFSKQQNFGKGWSTAGFHVHRTDGTSDDFSYIDAVNT
jgi:hypothetical protein